MNTDNTSTNEKKITNYSPLMTIFHSIMVLFAVYLSYRCNNGVNILSLLIAFCCPYCYILVIFAFYGGCNIFSRQN